MSQVLALAMRPSSFDELVGQEKLVGHIRGHFLKGRPPKGWLFAGETGCGKTTIARIMAVSYQCRHAEDFGSPCERCKKSYRLGKFSITEINASDTTTVEALRDTLQGSDAVPSPGSRKRIYILDEAQRLSKPSQNLLLKYFEDCPPTTVFIICTTHPEAIIRPLVRRCTGTYTVPGLDMEGIRTLVKRGLKFVRSELASSDLVEALWSTGVTSAGLIMNAVEKYSTGTFTAEEAARVEISTDFDTYALCRAVVKGDFEQCMKQMKEAKPEDAKTIRRSVTNYLKGILVDATEFSDRNKIVADSIYDLVSVSPYEDSLQLPFTVAALYRLCSRFSKYTH